MSTTPTTRQLEADMAPNGPDGTPVHYSCKAELEIISQDEELKP